MKQKILYILRVKKNQLDYIMKKGINTVLLRAIFNPIDGGSQLLPLIVF